MLRNNKKLFFATLLLAINFAPTFAPTQAPQNPFFPPRQAIDYYDGLETEVLTTFFNSNESEYQKYFNLDVCSETAIYLTAKYYPEFDDIKKLLEEKKALWPAIKADPNKPWLNLLIKAIENPDQDPCAPK